MRCRPVTAADRATQLLRCDVSSRLDTRGVDSGEAGQHRDGERPGVRDAGAQRRNTWLDGDGPAPRSTLQLNLPADHGTHASVRGNGTTTTSLSPQSLESTTARPRTEQDTGGRSTALGCGSRRLPQATLKEAEMESGARERPVSRGLGREGLWRGRVRSMRERRPSPVAQVQSRCVREPVPTGRKTRRRAIHCVRNPGQRTRARVVLHPCLPVTSIMHLHLHPDGAFG
ncbi:hypothetical protein C8Q80DRAFT_269957 [Daedaleopsis nitida]|nr:hypothetical protein C8Q80DRAFT_269957 [Daedaleopsis nitida]